MEILDKKQLAKLLNVSVRQIDFLRAEKGLPWLSFGALVRFDRSEVETWLEGRRRKGSPNQQEQDTESNEGKPAYADRE